jgi:hypothetical protein
MRGVCGSHGLVLGYECIYKYRIVSFGLRGFDVVERYGGCIMGR